MNKEILTEQDAAEYIGMSRSFLRQDRMMDTVKEERMDLIL